MKQEFGNRIRDLREDMDLNQTKLGKEVNMTQRKISYIENGTYEPSIDDIISFCKKNYLFMLSVCFPHTDAITLLFRLFYWMFYYKPSQ